MKNVTRLNNPYGDDKAFDGCSIFGVMDTSGAPVNASVAVEAIDLMRDRDNGLGGGFAGYGIYPEHPEEYAFHVMYASSEGRRIGEEYLAKWFNIEKTELMDVDPSALRDAPEMVRYFVSLPRDKVRDDDVEQYIADKQMAINTELPDSFVFSAAKNMGVFKGVGHPFDIARFFKLDQYNGYIWTAHGRFPTNTPGWWGGAHPFSLLDWTIVHNGEISSYGINMRFLEQYGYVCALQTDTEVVTYAVDLLVRRHHVPMSIAARVLAAPFWNEIPHMEHDEGQLMQTLRLTYSGLLMNGPFTIIIGRQGEMVGLTDRIRLRPLVVATRGTKVYLSSEESAIRLVEPELDATWIPVGGHPVIARLGQIPNEDETWTAVEVITGAH